MKRHRPFSSSDSSDECPSTSFTSGPMYRSKLKIPKEHKKPAEVFRKDLISAMKIPDSHHVNPDSYYLFADTWKEEWEKGVQVPANPDNVPQPSLRITAEKVKEILFVQPRKYIQCSSPEPAEPGCLNILELASSVCRYDLDDMDIFWLQELNEDLAEMGCGPVDENLMEKTVEVLERHCHENMNHAIETEEGLGIEYDEDVICDVCRSPDSEEGNDMVFCDKCNICVHQACYGILKVPEGSWLCRSCVLGIHPQCLLCPKKGGAMKSTRTGSKWAHVSCALWIPEVSIACPERMEPITKISHIPPSRWALVCSLCKLKTGACIQCSVKSCITAFHVTCAFEHSLEMKTILDEGDEVKFRSYCLKHSQNRQKLREAEYPHHRATEQSQAKSEKISLRAQKLRELEEEFYSFVRMEDVAAELGMPTLAVDYIYNYWKLKRKSNFNKPLFPPKEDEENALIQPKEESIHTRMRMFMHLRQDLERVRNLCYMISRREKLKLSQNKLQEQIFGLQVQLINQEIAAGLPLTTTPESSLFYPPPRITLKLKMPKSAAEDCRNGSTETDHQSCSPDSTSSGNDIRSLQALQESLEMSMQSFPRHPLESKNNCLPATLSHSRGEAKDSSPGWRSPSLEFYHGQSQGKPLVLQAALQGQSSIGNGKNQPSSKFAAPNGLEGNWSGNVTQKDSSHEMFSDQESVSSPHLASQCSFRKSSMDHFSRSFKETTNRWVKTTEDLQCYMKPTKNVNPKEQFWDRQLLRLPAGQAPYNENDGYCPDVELSDSETESDGNREKVRVKRESSDRENPSHDSRRECHGKSKAHPLSHSSTQR
ncbi:protein Jade-3 isoform X1 [Oryctolagus cuniculus]|uniref:Jade family PHD finger 3 n=1 Tax=Oryctolagus cuniculus TaxID=9986 RepID=G1SMA5_RABIT|nr:protein Jade-3 isoform X1 [Oryctolagus cuniculus]XP_008270748.1 protein Jade-3 isoform X1 [Oryctolagus cuniculus]XP_051683002.1 protein Jade-3 isoform X1 [Oryctolagus cuniculus]XP_051683003.1 protein Jade-3 isoform X1 [Oryctolagus cuniculus]XP_051683004.1 protein Jade-3 isoform X1 [Oryctolagus cuniculus]XP_051683005.1 protein Jade-3 isoform X1 [Oryctolagus cuniculus]XP_051683006.1 protein Jade-3 isoform X1 [Oryctolagus cuniculus]XP_051683007.1 protein Jade-3 isoform X1 [Oryctolagus cunicu